MNRNLPASSLAQTWQVGPSFDETESTQTYFVPRFKLSIEANEGRESRKLELSPGIYSFFLEDGQGLTYRNGKVPHASFELNIHKSGAFFVSLMQKGSAKLNSNSCAWARLKPGDRISLGPENLIVDANAFLNTEETVVSGMKTGLPSGVDACPPTSSNSKRSVKAFASVLALILLALLGIFFMPTDEPAPPMKVIAAVQTDELSQSLEAEEKQEPQKPQKQVIGRLEFESSLKKFRTHSAGACLELRELIANSERLHANNIWLEKALLLLKRRCA